MKFRKGMAICIEPMVNIQSPQIRMAQDGWTALAVDGLPSAHFEHTILVDEGKAEILTIPDGYEKAERFFADVLPA
jgi:methionyl aminopeptidase